MQQQKETEDSARNERSCFPTESNDYKIKR